MPWGMGESPLFKRVMRGTVQIIGGLGVGLLVAVLLVAWRLASGPVSIGFLTPYIDQALDELHQGAFDITFDDTILTWAGWERTLDIRVVNLRTTLPSGELVANIPEVSISLSAEALLQGTVAPRSVEFFGPSLKVVRQADGQFAMGFAGATEGSEDFVASMIVAMLQDPDPARAMSYLKRISVVAGEVTFEDNALGTTWHAPSADAAVTRTEGGLKAELNLDLQVGDKLAAVSVLGDYSPTGKRLDLGVSFEDVTPAAFAGLSDQMAVMGALDLPVSGTVTLSVEQDGRIEGFGFDLTGADGHLALPVPLAARLGALSWAQRVGVSELEISGHYEGREDVLDITRLALTAQPGETLYVPAPIDHAMPITKLDTALRYAGRIGRLDVSGLSMDVGGPRVDVSVMLANLKADAGAPSAQGLFADVTATAHDVPFDRLEQLWPKGLGDDARTWVLGGLTKGIADRATISVALRPAPGGTRLASLAGDIQGHGLDVRYLSTMPKVTNAKGSATFNEKRFDIRVESGESEGGLKVTGGDIGLVKLQEDLQWAEIKLDIEGPVPAALRLIDAEPLGFATDLGIHPDTAQGMAAANISLRIPLKHDLVATEVEAVASARLKGAGIRGAVFDKDISRGALDLAVDNNGLVVKGTAHLGEVPVQMTWNHDFRSGALFTDRYELSGYIEDVLNLGSLGVDVPDILARYMRGGAEANVNYTTFNDGRQALSARVDLANVALAAPELGWAKPSGVPGTAVLELRLDNDVPNEIPKFSVTAPDMGISGSATFLKDGALERIDLDAMRSGLTDVVGSLTPTENGVWEVVLRGESLDAGLLWDEMIGIRDLNPKENAEDSAGDDTREDDLMVNAAVDIRNLIIRKDRILHDLIGTVYRDRGLWRKMDVIGVTGDEGTVEVLLDTAPDGLRYLSIASNDAGAALKTLDLYDNIRGGVFDLKAAYTRPGKGAPLEGVAKVHNYAMIDAPAFTKLIGIMSLTGVLDALQGSGLNFDVLDAPFKLEGGVLELTQARASGPTLGVTASGQVDMGNRALDLRGTVVPAYAINALLGKIPLIGELFTGSAKGGGLFAATYSMKGKDENVDITVNPLSALAPGALRDIFTGSDKEGEIPEVAPESQPSP